MQEKIRDDTIDRQAAIDAFDCTNELIVGGEANARNVVNYINKVVGKIKDLPSAQPDITDEQAIGHLQASGWMQSHDKQMYEMGLKERLADDSDSYDALLPSAQPEIIRCKECKHKHIEKTVWVCPFGLPGGPEFFCGYGSERREE